MRGRERSPALAHRSGDLLDRRHIRRVVADRGGGAEDANVVASSHASPRPRSAPRKLGRPPDHGARLVTMILTDDALRADWHSELEEMRLGMLDLRTQLAAELQRLRQLASP